MSSFEFFVTEKNALDFDFAPPLLLHPRDSPWRVHRCCKRGNYVLFLSPNFPNVWCTHVRLRWYSYTWNLSLPENQIPINVFRRPTESSHQIHASLCVPLIQVQHLFNKILWCNTSAADNLSILSQRMLHPYLLDTVYLRLTWTLYFWSTLLPPQGLTSPKPERGCVKTDCFDEALCREYEQHHVIWRHQRLIIIIIYVWWWWWGL